MHVFITGVSGFVGQHLARHLLACGDRVSGSYLGAPPQLSGAEVAEIDLADTPDLTRAIREAAPDAVVHLAGWSQVGASWQHMGECFRANVLGTENVLQAAAGATFVLASSAEVYGPVAPEQQPLHEDAVPDPQSPYALTKAAAERLVLAAGGVVVRCFNVVGPGQSPHFALPAFTAQLAAIERGEQEPVLRVGNLSARRDFVHAEDAARAYRLLAARGARGRIYNLATGSACSVGEALERLLVISGVAARVEPDPQRLRPVDVPLLVGDNRRLRELGWQPEHSLDQALEDLWRAR